MVYRRRLPTPDRLDALELVEMQPEASASIALMTSPWTDRGPDRGPGRVHRRTSASRPRIAATARGELGEASLRKSGLGGKTAADGPAGRSATGPAGEVRQGPAGPCTIAALPRSSTCRRADRGSGRSGAPSPRCAAGEASTRHTGRGEPVREHPRLFRSQDRRAPPRRSTPPDPGRVGVVRPWRISRSVGTPPAYAPVRSPAVAPIAGRSSRDGNPPGAVGFRYAAS